MATSLVLQALAVAQPSAIVKPAFPDPLTAGNGFYRVYMNATRGTGVGLFTATTGKDHPLGSEQEVLHGRGRPGTSLFTIRSYTTRTDYVQSSGVLPSSRNVVLSLDPLATPRLLFPHHRHRDLPSARPIVEIAQNDLLPRP
jgi:hypothetical protein